MEVVRSDSNKDKKKYVSLTSGFSIRRNSNNTNNPYTLTLLTRPYEEYDNSRRNSSLTNSQGKQSRYYYESSSETNEKVDPSTESRSADYHQSSSENPMRRKDSRPEISEEYDVPAHIRPTSRTKSKPKVKSTTAPSTSSTKYYLKSVIRRPAPFSKDSKEQQDSNEHFENVGVLTEAGLENVRPDNEIPDAPDNSNPIISITPRVERGRWQNYWNEPTISPYKTLDKLRNNSRQENVLKVATTSVTPTPFTTTTAKNMYYADSNKHSRINPSYYSYRLEDEVVPDQTTEVFSGKVKNVIKAFLDFSSPAPQSIEEFSSSTFKPSSTAPQPKQQVVNIGFHKKTVKYGDEKSVRNNVKHLQIITEPSVSRFFTSSVGKVISQDFSSTTPTKSTIPFISTTPATTTPFIIETSTFGRQYVPNSEIYQSKFDNFMTNAPQPIVTTAPIIESSRKFQNIFKVEPTAHRDDDFDKSDQPKPAVQAIIETTKASDIEWQRPSIEEVKSEIASTTSTTKSTTTTVKKVPTTKSTKNILSLPTRASRVNPAIKLAASNPGSGRRSYQSSSKCSSDNSLQDPKCNEIKYQRYITRRLVV